MSITNANMLKTANRVRIFELLHQNEMPMTQQEMAKETGLTVASIGNILIDLEKAQLLQEAGRAVSNGGRKPTLYTLDNDRHYLVGVSISVKEVIFVITTLKGEIIYQGESSFSLSEDAHIVLERVIEQIKKVIEAPEFTFSKMTGLGISSPGPINAEEGIILSPPHLPLWKNVEVVSVFKEHFQTIVCLEKDANCMLLGEWHYGRARKSDHVLYFMIDFGIGSSYMINGRLIRGATHLAGEVGFNGQRSWQKDNISGKPLYSILPIIEETKAKIHQGFETSLPKDIETIEELLEEYGKGDALAVRIINESIEDVGQAIADKVNFLNPELVVIGGRLMTALPDFSDKAEEVIKGCIYAEMAEAVKFIPSSFGREAEAVGASALLIKRVLH